MDGATLSLLLWLRMSPNPNAYNSPPPPHPCPPLPTLANPHQHSPTLLHRQDPSSTVYDATKKLCVASYDGVVTGCKTARGAAWDWTCDAEACTATCPHQCRQGDGKWEWDSAHEKCSTCRRFTSKSACEVHLCNMKGDGCCA